MKQETGPTQQSNNTVFQWFVDLKRFASPSAIVLFWLGFSAGLPFLLVAGGTLSAWLKDAGLEYRSIGFFAWVGLSFSLKVLWAPLVDRLGLPLLGRLGQRRSWLLISQLSIMAGLYCMSILDPSTQTTLLGCAAVFVAFWSATQDVCIDAYRIQSCEADIQGIVTTAYIAGYRVALLVAGAGALLIADDFNWQVSYQIMACFMGAGVVTVLLMKEPIRLESGVFDRAKLQEKKARLQACLPRLPNRLAVVIVVVWASILEPFVEMLTRFGRWIILLLAVVLFYRVSDVALGNMANPFYLALGYTKSDIAWATKVTGLFLMLAGAAFGGILVLRKGLFMAMIVCLVAVIGTNLLFALLASVGATCLIEPQVGCSPPHLIWLGVVVGVDNIAAGASNVVFIAFLSHQVKLEFSATQYALMSSLMTLLGKFMSGFSGVIVESFGFFSFFIYTSSLGLPSLILILALRYGCPKCFLSQSAADVKSCE